MEPAESSLSVKVPQILHQIYRLQEEVAKETDELTKTLLHCEILRCFSLLEWAFHLEESRRGLLTEQETGHLESLRNLVAMEREAASATKKDLESLKIPGGIRKAVGGAGNVDSFPNYLELPAEVVRTKILSYLTDPQDKMNLLKAIPSEGHLIGWDLADLQFQMVLPILMKSRVLDWKAIYNLSRVNASFRDSIQRYFEAQILSEPISKRRRLMSTGGMLNAAINCGDPEMEEWCRGFNPTSDLLILEHLLRHDEDREAHTTAALNLLGHRILIGEINLNDWRPALEQLKSACRYLAWMPNLVSLCLHLEFSFFPGVDPEGIPGNGLTIDDIQLPELKKLKKFILSGRGSGQIALVKQRLLEKYAPGILQLCVIDAYPEMEDNFRIHSPSLYSLDVDGKGATLDLFFRYANMFLDSPLTKIKLEVVDPDGRSRFASLMIYLSGHFGGSLEELTIYLGIGNSDQRYSKILELEEQTSSPPPSPSSSWMLDCKFPKVKSLSLDCFPCLQGMVFLLLFPALENLTFAKIDKPREITCEEDDPVGVVSASVEQMRTSGVWKFLPHLQVITFKGEKSWFSSSECEVWKVTRKECIACQVDNK